MLEVNGKVMHRGLTQHGISSFKKCLIFNYFIYLNNNFKISNIFLFIKLNYFHKTYNYIRVNIYLN